MIIDSMVLWQHLSTSRPGNDGENHDTGEQLFVLRQTRPVVSAIRTSSPVPPPTTPHPSAHVLLIRPASRILAPRCLDLVA